MKYWTYMKGEVPGSFPPEALAELPGFGMTTLVCPSEGEIKEKNWRPAGEFPDLAAAVTAREARRPPAPPLGAPPVSAGASEVNALIDTASTRLFGHVAQLMSELETRRDEKALVLSLQRQIAALKEDVDRERSRAGLLELRMPRIDALEAALRENTAALEAARNSLREREARLDENRGMIDQLKGELDVLRRSRDEAASDLAIRNKLVDKLSHDVAEKELSLAKALGVIRRLEQDLGAIGAARPAFAAELPSAAAPAEAASAESAAAAPVELPPLPVFRPVEPPPAHPPRLPSVSHEPLPPTPIHPPPLGAFTEDDPPPPPPYIEPDAPNVAPAPEETPKAHQALLGFLRRVFPGQSH